MGLLVKTYLLNMNKDHFNPYINVNKIIDEDFIRIMNNIETIFKGSFNKKNLSLKERCRRVMFHMNKIVKVIENNETIINYILTQKDGYNTKEVKEGLLILFKELKEVIKEYKRNLSFSYIENNNNPVKLRSIDKNIYVEYKFNKKYYFSPPLTKIISYETHPQFHVIATLYSLYNGMDNVSTIVLERWSKKDQEKALINIVMIEMFILNFLFAYTYLCTEHKYDYFEILGETLLRKKIWDE